MAWKPQVKVMGEGDRWSSNSLVFATEAEARANASDLFDRWYACTDHGAVEVDEPVTHTYVDGVLGHLPKAEGSA